MRRIHICAILLTSAGLLVGAACSSDQPGAAVTPQVASSPGNDPPIKIGAADAATSGCRPDRSAPPPAQITVVYKQVLYGVLPDGSALHCLMGPPITNLRGWSVDGTALLVGELGQASFLSGLAQDYAYMNSDDRTQDFMRPKPTGVYIVTGDGSVDRYEFGGGGRHTLVDGLGATAVATSPDGSRIAVAGATDTATVLSIVDIGSGDRRELVSIPTVSSESATTLYATVGEPTFLSDQQIAYLEGDPGNVSGPYNLRVVDTTTGKIISQASVGTQLEEEASTDLVARDSLVAAKFGTCSSEVGTTVYDMSSATPSTRQVTRPSAYSFVVPVGWLPDRTLVLLAKEQSCEGPGDVVLWSADTGTARVFMTGVTEAAVRAPGSHFVPATMNH